MLTPFHLAIHVTDLDAARAFYGGVLGCAEGRATDTWVDFDFFGHQLSLHLGAPFATADTGRVGEHMVAMPHFGMVLALEDWRALAASSAPLADAGPAMAAPSIRSRVCSRRSSRADGLTCGAIVSSFRVLR